MFLVTRVSTYNSAFLLDKRPINLTPKTHLDHDFLFQKTYTYLYNQQYKYRWTTGFGDDQEQPSRYQNITIGVNIYSTQHSASILLHCRLPPTYTEVYTLFIIIYRKYSFRIFPKGSVVFWRTENCSSVIRICRPCHLHLMVCIQYLFITYKKIFGDSSIDEISERSNCHIFWSQNDVLQLKGCLHL